MVLEKGEFCWHNNTLRLKDNLSANIIFHWTVYLCSLEGATQLDCQILKAFSFNREKVRLSRKDDDVALVGAESEKDCEFCRECNAERFVC